MKAYICYIPDENSAELHNVAKECYLKSEADKVIAEKDKKIALYKRGWEDSDRINAGIYAELRHQKYKRCLAMADKCEAWIRLDVSPRHTHRFIRWYKIWLELADKFKEAK